MRPLLVPRKGARLTRAQVAKRLGVSVSTVRNLEGRELFPAIDGRGIRYFDAGRVEEIAERMEGEGFVGLAPEEHRKAKALCAELGTTLSAWVREQIETKLLAG